MMQLVRSTLTIFCIIVSVQGSAFITTKTAHRQHSIPVTLCLAFTDSLQTLFPAQAPLIGEKLQAVGFTDDKSIAAIFSGMEPDQITRVLQQDFGLDPLVAHQTRAALSHSWTHKNTKSTTSKVSSLSLPTEENNNTITTNTTKKQSFKQVIVNEKAKQRSDDYGLPKDFAKDHPQLALELEEFHDFMIKPNTYAQEEPIRSATAVVYIRHAKLFLGWYQQTYQSTQLSVYTVIPTNDKESVTPILEFLQWLRTQRHSSASYQANFLRGLIKLVKFRFRKESQHEIEYGGKSFDDIVVVRELRKWHRQANRQQAVAAKSSDETRKWLSWPEFLQVVAKVKHELEDAIRKEKQGRVIATLFQRYLILTFFAQIPDRQRTMRELEIGRSFVKDNEQNCWCIRHSPEDYKTGKTYGARPTLMLSPSLTPAIHDFIDNWRQHLQPVTETLFCQPRTGRPLTQDSLYQIVGRACHQHTGQRTNPHLLRDMIVTHVREGEASEAQLEALALYMGHSIAVQRASYDRRTLTKKVAPAVELLQSVNANLES